MAVKFLERHNGGESLDTVRIGKKAISFVADLDTCHYDPSKFALTQYA